MQGEDALRTVECLRGRLLAERATSREANETVELLSNKMKELEEKLKIEIRCRKKAEKRLSILKKKLESLNILFSVSDESEQSSSSDHSETSCISSVTSTSENAEQADKIRSEINIADDHGLKEPASEYKSGKDENEEQEGVDNSMALVPVSFPIDEPAISTNNHETRVNSESVRQVLGTLKQIRENIQSTIERRGSIKVS